MNSLMNYGSDGENSSSDESKDITTMKASLGAKGASDAIYDPVPMDMSEESNNGSDDSGSERNTKVHTSNAHKTDGSRNSTSTSDQRRTDNEERSSSSREKEHSSSKHKSDDYKVDKHENKNSRHSSDKKSDDRKRDHKDSRDGHKKHKNDDRKSRDDERRSRDSDKRKDRSSRDDHREDKKDRDRKEDKDRRRDRGRDKERRDSSKDKSRDRSRDKSRERDRSRERGRERRHKSNDRSKHREDRRSKERGRSRSRSRSRERIHRPFISRDERGKNKLAQLEKLGIEIKTTEEILQSAHQEFYNPLTTASQGKYAEQIQKRKLLWQHKKQDDKSATTGTTSTANTWVGTTFTHDQDGKVTAKFKRLMGIKGDMPATTAPGVKQPDILKKQEEMFSNMEQQYEVARATTHTQRGVGLGYASGYSFPR